ncbi:MAG: hypothetical protein HY889_08905 [Deltaproteobacteria bacterium]|nr:hypothetical protein [Deltaproteobacteria bacterium]
MPTPLFGDLIESTVGKIVDKITDKYLPPSMSEKEKAEHKLEARKLALDEYKTAIADVQGARELAGKESEGAPGWTKVLTVTHRPVWSFVMLGIFVWTVLAPYIGFPGIPLTQIHKEIMQTVIIFYFGGRSVEKAAETVWGKS